MRTRTISKLQEKTYDLLIVGGGATGSGIALDAASRGLSVALIEKGDFASGTSSKSTKLIHGGLRYLKQLDFGLVRETGTERAVVNKIAPHLCLPEKMLLPITEDGTYGKWSSSLGLMVYDVLAGVEREDRRKMLSPEETLAKEPLLNADTLVGGGYYAEYRTDDARLTIELIKKSVTYGADVINYMELTEFASEGEKINGAICYDRINNETITIRARRVVSAAGPWVDHLRAKNDSLQGSKLHLTKGVHLVFPQEKFPVKQSIYFDEPGGRMLFAIPRGRVTYLGTTDTSYTGSMDRIVCTKEDRDYLLSAVNRTFPSINLTADDVISNWAGLRPLIHEEGKSPSELSRKDEIFEAEDGLISIAGGKLTGYRKMAERIVDKVIELDHKGAKDIKKDSITAKIPLAQDKAMTNREVQKYIDELADRCATQGLDRYYGWYLVTVYGRQAERILDSISGTWDHVSLAIAELDYCIDHEYVTRAEDFLVRRTGRLYFDIGSISSILEPVLDRLSERMNWMSDRVATERQRMEDLLYDATHYYDEELPRA